jgi:hypothetical protein
MRLRATIWTCLLALLAVMPAAADNWCADGGWDSDERHCEVREMRLAADRSTIEVDAGPNGGISVTAWDSNEILVEAKVMARADTYGEAADLASQVEIETHDVIRASGPSGSRHRSWWVSFRLKVPRSSNLALEANNGGIDIDGVVGDIEFDTTNGGIHLERVGGWVHGETTNGGVKVELDGDSWEGSGLDVETTNGGVKLLVPSSYNARLETGTVNGGIEVDFPITVEGKLGRELSVDLGSGGQTLRVMTTNGGVRIDRL